ncbi:MAG: alanine racemase [Actinomycetota bacterium]|nr:alanine racemase [Actinomycetota bacterium]
MERALARVDLGAVERNAARLRSLLTGGAGLCAVVKADGYGHGMVPSARAALAGGATWLGVATAAEAAELRAHGVGAPILVQGALTPDEIPLALDCRADVVAWRTGLVDAIAANARAAGIPARIHVKLDTGMGRLGTKDPAEARAVAERVAAADDLELVGLMTHFATADEPRDAYFAEQLERFRRWVEEVRPAVGPVVVHAANSAATMQEPASHFDLVRCGIAVYGLDPFGADPTARGLEPALSLHSYVAEVKRFSPRESAGYGRAWRAPASTWVGVLPIGYGDGWRRGLSNNADVLVGGRRYPLVGTISMDNVTIDLGPETDVGPGAPAVLIGAQGEERILCEEVARRLATINYEVTCGLLPRVPRLHLDP